MILSMYEVGSGCEMWCIGGRLKMRQEGTRPTPLIYIWSAPYPSEQAVKGGYTAGNERFLYEKRFIKSCGADEWTHIYRC